MTPTQVAVLNDVLKVVTCHGGHTGGSYYSGKYATLEAITNFLHMMDINKEYAVTDCDTFPRITPKDKIKTIKLYCFAFNKIDGTFAVEKSDGWVKLSTIYFNINSNVKLEQDEIDVLVEHHDARPQEWFLWSESNNMDKFQNIVCARLDERCNMAKSEYESNLALRDASNERKVLE